MGHAGVMEADTAPFTLRSAAGLATTPWPLRDCTVVVIDAQVEYASGALVLPGIDDAVANIVRLLQQARGVGAPVVHVAHRGLPGGMFDPAAGGRIIDSVAPHRGEPVVDKRLPNAFAGTDLAGRLKGLGDAPLVLAGFMTHMCVSATARAALDLGFDAIVASDATGTRALPAADGGDPIDAAAVHRVALAALADRFSAVAATDAILAA